MTPDPILDEIPEQTEIKTTDLNEMVRNKTGLVNLIRPPRPQPPRQKQRYIRQGGSAARKILKRRKGTPWLK